MQTLREIEPYCECLLGPKMVPFKNFGFMSLSLIMSTSSKLESGFGFKNSPGIRHFTPKIPLEVIPSHSLGLYGLVYDFCIF